MVFAAILQRPPIGRIIAADAEGERLTPDPLLRIKSSASAVLYVKGQTRPRMKCLMVHQQGGHVNDASGHKTITSLMVFIFLNSVFPVSL